MSESAMKNFRVVHSATGICQVVLDVPGRPMNVLSHDVMTELEAIVADLHSRRDLRLVVFKSGKESGFLAGADVSVIQSIDSPAHANELLLRGQELFERVQTLPMPTLAVIHGPCLGGGLEWALAMDYRIARENSSTQIGLPEIKLGLIPGWGGTQRLPKTVGLQTALTMILSGKSLTVSEALNCGLIDRAIDPDQWRDEVLWTMERLAAGGSIGPWGLKRRMMRMAEAVPMVRDRIMAVARKSIRTQMMHYPALESAIDAIESGCTGGDGYAAERRAFSELIGTRTCRELLRLFFSREKARSLKTWTPNSGRTVHRKPIRKVGVVGAGAMGAGIAQLAATRGFSVRVTEADQRGVKLGGRRLDDLVGSYARHKRLTPSQRQQLRQRIHLSDEPDTLCEADCVIEAVVEKMDVKQSVLAAAEDRIGNAAILATNTSALSVSEMAASLKKPERFAGLHFFNPVARMELVEVVRGNQTSDSTIAALVSWVRALGKTPVVTADSPGFLVNRVLFPYLGEAVLMLREGHDVQRIDAEIRQFGMPMGPFELLDRVGLDVALHVADSLADVLPGTSEVIDVLSPLVRRHQIGRKAGVGFYRYDGDRKHAREVGEMVKFLTHALPAAEFVPDGLTPTQRRLIYPMLVQSIRCKDERVVDSAWAIDLAMVLGTGFAPHLGGPLRVVDSVGVQKVLANLNGLRHRYGSRFSPPAMLSRCCRTGEPLAEEFSH